MRSLALLIVLAAQANALCYYPDGTPASGDVPCTDNTDNSVCCGTGYACLSNGVCQATGDELRKPGASEFVRGSCTDKTFRSSACPSFCGTPNVDNVGGGEGMEKCANTKQDLYWCINQRNIALSQKEDPCTDQNAVVFFPGTPTAITTIGVAQKSTTSSSTTSTPTAMATSTSSSSSTANAGTETGTSTATSASSPPAETTPASGGSKSSSNGGVIGGAVGGSLGGVALVGVLAFLFIRRRRGRRDKGIHEMDYTPVEPKTSSTPLVHHPLTPHDPDDIRAVHEAPGSTQFEPAKRNPPDEPMELPA